LLSSARTGLGEGDSRHAQGGARARVVKDHARHDAEALYVVERRSRADPQGTPSLIAFVVSVVRLSFRVLNNILIDYE
jgi:hypothetical protein